MKTRIYAPELGELALLIDYPDLFKSDDAFVIERNYTIDESVMGGTYKEMFFEGIHNGYGDFRLPKTTLIHFDTDLQTIEMHFALQGNAKVHSRNFTGQLGFSNNQHNLLYACEFKGSVEWSNEKDMKVFEVNLWPSFFEKHLPESGLFDTFRNSIEKKQSAILSPHNFPITPQMVTLIHQIINCNRTGRFKRIFLESHVLELLMLQLEQIDNHNCEVFCAISKQQEEKIFAVKEILTQHLSGDFTLNSLAQSVGTNEFTLKKGFKELFGISVFGYWNQLKMQEARKLIMDRELSIKEVSNRIGYKNPQHFSTAFKRYYGYSPSELRSL